MMESRKKIMIFIGIVLFLILVAIVAFLFFKKKPAPLLPETPVVSTPVENIPTPEVKPVVKDIVPPPPATTEEREKLFLRQFARTFVERFESTSSQNDNRNITDAIALATEKMKPYLQSKATPQTAEYHGVTTKVISMDVSEFSSTDAVVKIGAQVITESVGSSQTSYKNGSVNLKKIDGTWKVDGLFWDAI